VEGSCEHGNKPSGSIKCWEALSRCKTGGLSTRAQLHGISWLVSIVSIMGVLITFLCGYVKCSMLCKGNSFRLTICACDSWGNRVKVRS
jgi:hypothetical protein